LCETVLAVKKENLFISKKKTTTTTRDRQIQLNLTGAGINERASIERITQKLVFKMKLKWENSVFDTEYAYINSI
jgi:hypothetical protein